MADLIEVKSSFLKKNEINKIQYFLKKNWNKKHLFCTDRKILKWQHFFEDKFLFLCEKKNGKIKSLVGVINQSRDKSFKVTSIGILCSNYRMGVVNIFKKLDLKNFSTIKAIGLTKEIIPLYKINNYTVGSLKIYYIKNLNIKYSKIFKNLSSHRRNKKKIELLPNNINEIVDKNLAKKDKKYLKWRFISHPYYEYEFIESPDKKLILIYREIKINGFKFVRIVDFLGTFKNQENFISSLSNFCEINNYHFIEFMHHGYQDRFIKKTIFKLLKNNQKIPINVEPFDNFKKKNLYFAYKYKKNLQIKLVRADADADRPNKKK
jgi:hypothetical protein